MKVLHLTLKKHWFDMIASGEKKEEYRAIKPYWITRLANKHNGCIGGDFMDNHKVIAYTFKDFDVVCFKNGYAKDAPCITLEIKGIIVGLGLPKWGAELDVEYFIIKLGKLLHKEPNQERSVANVAE